MLKIITINAITNYIEDNIERYPITTEKIVKFTGFSRRYLQLHFKKHVGISIGKYIQLRRISRAAVLLKLTNLSLINIADKLFYDSQQTFTREFRKNTGHTPLRYRKHKTWTFCNLMGQRYAGMHFPVPEIRYFDQISTHGIYKVYKERIPYTGIHSESRWDTINNMFSKKNVPICISNKVQPAKKMSNELEIHTVYWTPDKKSGQQIFLPEGLYAYFRFKGNVNSYIRYINNAYMNILPFYGLQKRDDYDIEIISNDNECFLFEYYLPVTIFPSPQKQ